MRAVLPLLLALPLIAGCDAEGDVTTTNEVSVSTQDQASFVSPPPPYAPDYPGGEFTGGTTTTAAQQTVTGRDSAKTTTATRTQSKTFTTRDTPDAVVGFYKPRAEAGGLRAMRETSSTDGRRELSASRAGAQLTVVAVPENGRTKVTITYTVPAG